MLSLIWVDGNDATAIKCDVESTCRDERSSTYKNTTQLISLRTIGRAQSWVELAETKGSGHLRAEFHEIPLHSS